MEIELRCKEGLHGDMEANKVPLSQNSLRNFMTHAVDFGKSCCIDGIDLVEHIVILCIMTKESSHQSPYYHKKLDIVYSSSSYALSFVSCTVSTRNLQHGRTKLFRWKKEWETWKKLTADLSLLPASEN